MEIFLSRKPLYRQVLVECSICTDTLFTWIRVAVSKLVITVDWFSAYRNRKAVQNALHINISHHCCLHHAMHNAKDHPLCVSTENNSVLMISILIG